MSPGTKKMLMIAAAAVGGYIVYTKFIKKPAQPQMAMLMVKPLATTTALKTAAVDLASRKLASLSGDPVLEALGIQESLGSLGGKPR